MQKLGLTSEERRAFHDVLRSSHTRSIYVTVTDLDGRAISPLNNRILDGQVTVDYAADVTRALSLSLLDPTHSLNFDTDSPDDGALFADRMIRVHYSVYVPSLARRVSVPVFHGPVTKLERDGDVVNVEAQGKEALAMGAIWRPLVLKKGTRITDGIKTLLRDRSGERRTAIPDLKARLPKARNFDRMTVPWTAARNLARAADKHLFYTGDGTATLRNLPNRAVWTFETGTGGDVVSDVAVSYVMDDVKNTIIVLGRKDAKKKRVRAQAVAPPNHPLSPKRLGRAGTPRHLVEVVEDESIRSNKAARRRAKRILDDRLRETVEVTFDALPIPHLDPGDLVRVRTDDFTTTFRLKQFTIPLGANGAPTMSVGYLKARHINRRRIRR